jgi:hypothetical protein
MHAACVTDVSGPALAALTRVRPDETAFSHVPPELAAELILHVGSLD